MVDFRKTIRDFEGNYDKKKSVRERDAKNFFVSGGDGSKLVYEVFVKTFSPLNLGLTVIEPGSVGKEFYMTKGHVHARKIPEFYVLLEGSGILLMQKGKPKVVKLKKGKLVLIPEGYAHRLVNNGRKKMKVLTVYHEDSKPRYGVKFKRRFFRK